MNAHGAARLLPSTLLPPALLLLLAACAVEPSASATPSVSTAASAPPVLRSVPAPELYYPTAEAIAAAAPGEIIQSVAIRAPAGTRAWFVVYGSTGLDGKPVAVSGIVLAPETPPTGSGYPVVAWAHGTTGIADRCAPSREGVAGVGFKSLVAQGYVVTATDYEGLGTDGIHPYIVGVSEGRSVLDSIRAAVALPEAHAGASSVVIGASQGGHAALWAAELAPTYAPELELLGALAASPPTDLVAWETWAFGNAALGSIFQAAAPVLVFGVWNDVYGLPLDFLTDEGRQSALAGRDACDPTPVNSTPYLGDPAQIPGWRDQLAKNSPGATRTEIPIRVDSPRGDELVQYDTQLAGVRIMCEVGDTVELRSVDGGHDATFASATAYAQITAWIADRFAGVAPVSTCGA